jgi:hypothetical protein
MSDTIDRLVGGLLDSAVCYACETPFELEVDDLDEGTDLLYHTDYSCTGCEIEYSVEIEDYGHGLSLEAHRTDQETPGPDDFAEITMSARKEALQEQTHPARDLVEGLSELGDALELLYINKNRIVEACETVRTDEDGISQGDEFHTEINTDLHNYMASAYTFEEILGTLEPNLPTDGPVESAKSDFEDEKKVITGLRTYTQHHLTLPWVFSDFTDENLEQRVITLAASLDDVDTIESDLDRFPPDGYMRGASHHYGNIKGDSINIERRVKLHFEAASDLVDTIYNHASDVHGEDLKEYDKVTKYT